MKSNDINEFKDDLDSLLNDLDFAKKSFNKINEGKTRSSIEKLIDSLDGEQIVIKNNDNIEPKASEATKELENLMNSLSEFNVESNDNYQTPSSKSAYKTPLLNNICEGCGEAINGQVKKKEFLKKFY
jgi:hypothetical protein